MTPAPRAFRRIPPAASLLALCACSPRILAVRTIAPALERGADAFYEEPDPQLAREALPSQLLLVEGLLKNDPGNPHLLAIASQSFGGYAFLFLEDSQPDRARQFYLRGREWGAKLMSRNADLRGCEEMPLSDLQRALAKATSRDVPGLFWSAYGWAGWINLSKDAPEAVAGLPKVAAIMRRVQELSPGYFHGGPNLFLGSYYATLPKMLGGDPAKSKECFEAALREGGGRFLLAKTLYAQYYAVAVQDQELFKRLNGEVLDSSEADPEVRLANEVAKMKSKRLMERMNELF